MSNFIFVFFNLLGGGVGLLGGNGGVEFGKFVGGKVVQCHEDTIAPTECSQE